MRLAALLWLAFASGLIGGQANGGTAIRDIDGRAHRPFQPADTVYVLLFVMSDCPISNAYAPEIQRICQTSVAREFRCLLLYEDAQIAAPGVRAHRQAYGYSPIAAAIDARAVTAARAGASIAPEAVVVDRSGTVRYRGRIDNLYADLGRRRQAATVHDLRDALDAVLSGREVSTPRTEAHGCYITRPDSRSEKSR